MTQAAGNTRRRTCFGPRRVNLVSSAAVVYRQSTVAATNSFAVPHTVSPAHRQWNGPSDRLDHDTKSLSAVLEHRAGPNTTFQMLNAFVGCEWKILSRLSGDLQVNVENVPNRRLRIGGGSTGYSHLAPTKFIVQSSLRF